jgi:hypothetical protein
MAEQQSHGLISRECLLVLTKRTQSLTATDRQKISDEMGAMTPGQEALIYDEPDFPNGKDEANIVRRNIEASIGERIDDYFLTFKNPRSTGGYWRVYVRREG